MTSLATLRRRYGYTHPIGRRCTNLLEQFDNYGKETDPEARGKLAVRIQRQKTKLEGLLVSRGDRG